MVEVHKRAILPDVYPECNQCIYAEMALNISSDTLSNIEDNPQSLGLQRTDSSAVECEITCVPVVKMLGIIRLNRPIRRIDATTCETGIKGVLSLNNRTTLIVSCPAEMKK